MMREIAERFGFCLVRNVLALALLVGAATTVGGEEPPPAPEPEPFAFFILTPAR